MGMIVDDVSKRHLKSTTEYATYTIQTPDGDIIDLKTRAALSTFIFYKDYMGRMERGKA